MRPGTTLVIAAAFFFSTNGACSNDAPPPASPNWGYGQAPYAPAQPYPGQAYPGQVQLQPYPGQAYPQQPYPQQQAYPQPAPQYGSPAQPAPAVFPQFQIPTFQNAVGWLPQFFPPASPNQPQPNPLPVPVSPTTPSTCLISDTAQTWSANLHCNQGSGSCNRNDQGSLVIKRTGPTTALVVAEGQYTDSASFDASSCTVSHSGLKPKAVVDITISYSIVVDGGGGLSGSADVAVNGFPFTCSGKYSVSGSKK